MSLECSICEGDARAGCDCWERVRALEASGMSRKQAVAQVSGVAAPDAPRPVTLEAMLRDSFERVDHERQDFAATRAALTARWLSDRGVRIVPPGAVVVDPEGEIPEAVVDALLVKFSYLGDSLCSPTAIRDILRAALRAWPKK